MTVEPSDAELVARCLEAKDAFEEIYRRHAPAVYAFLRGMHRGDEHAAADTLQETFFRAYRALPRFDCARALRPWLFTIAGNASLDALAKQKRVEARDPEAIGELIGAAREAEPDERAVIGDTCASLLRAVRGRLPERKLAAFLLARGQGLSYAEIAEIHDCSAATVKRDLSDALAVLTGAASELGLVGE